MNLQRLSELYERKMSPEQADIESLKLLISEYPYFSKPFVILARYYYQSSHYKFEDMLRKAAIRVSDRKALYDYIHGIEETLIAEESIQEELHSTASIPSNNLSEFLEPESETEVKTQLESEDSGIQSNSEVITTEAEVVLTEEKPIEIEAFQETLSEIAEQDSVLHTEKPFEFEFEGHFRTHGSAEEPDESDIIGEEIMTEFSFSKEFNRTESMPEHSELLNNESEDTAAEEAIPELEVRNESIVETTIEETQDVPDLSLRKYPVYSVEEFLEDREPEDAETEINNDSESSDFLSWLSHPKSGSLSKQKETIEQEPEVEPEKPASGKGMDLIERFIAINPQISRPKKEFFNPENMAKRSEIPDTDLVSETLAEIYYQQGNYLMAISAYEKLSLQNPSKQAYFAGLIEKIKKESK
jgi:tetratricopeptide (TPR) repeat protein